MKRGYSSKERLEISGQQFGIYPQAISEAHARKLDVLNFGIPQACAPCGHAAHGADYCSAPGAEGLTFPARLSDYIHCPCNAQQQYSIVEDENGDDVVECLQCREQFTLDDLDVSDTDQALAEVKRMHQCCTNEPQRPHSKPWPSAPSLLYGTANFIELRSAFLQAG